jgi:Na+/proline symporter
MKTKEILTSGLAGTTFMTLFSYLVSLADGENFSEPERLGQLTGRLIPKLDKQQSQALGWLGHYGVGLLFALVYAELWRRGKLKPDLKTNLWLGALSGLLAVAVWKTTFKMHPLPPSLSFNKYYLQLVPAHLVFAVFAGIGYQILKKTNNATDH